MLTLQVSQPMWARLPALILCYDSAYLFTFELFLELRIVQVLETALAKPEEKFFQ